MPGAQRPAELLELAGHVAVAKVLGELAEIGAGRLGELVVEPAQGLLRVPRHAHLALGVTGLEEPEELLVALVVETFVALGEQSSRSIQRVVLVAAVAEREIGRAHRWTPVN